MPRRNQVQSVIVHCSDTTRRMLLDIVNQFHIDCIERRLQAVDLTGPEKAAIIDKIIASLKSREGDGIIK